MSKLRITIFIFLLAAWLFIVYEIRETSQFIEAISNIATVNAFGVFFFIFLQAIFAALVLPCSTFTLIAGSVWGIEYGIVISTIATVFSSSLTYTIARFAKKRTRRLIINSLPTNVIFFAGNNPFTTSLLFHVNPLVPGSISGYIFGLRRIQFTKYISGSLVGTLPLQFFLVFIGNGLVR